MQLNTQDRDLLAREPTRLLAAPALRRLPLLAKLVLAVGFAWLLGFAGYFAAVEHPDTSPPRGSELERQIADVFGLPEGKSDDSVVGDFLVERFYALDVETGEHYVADVLKGRIEGVQPTLRPEGSTSYTLLLDLRNLQRDRALYAAYVSEVARPQAEGLGDYLGLRAPPGVEDAFPLNYDGNLPMARLPFLGPDGEDVYSFLLQQKYADVTATPRLISQEGFNYLLSNSDRYPFFRSFGVNKALFVSELIVVDATSRAQERTFYRLLEQYPRSQAR